MRKGIVLAGGTGTRLYPATKAVSKQLQIVYDKPMIYYPLSILMLAGIKDILIISTPHDTPLMQRLFPDHGKNLGVKLEFAVQTKPEGIAQAFIIAEDFLAGASCMFILGDNIFHGMGLPALLKSAEQELNANEVMIFTYPVQDPEQYGIVVCDQHGRPSELIEKPQQPVSNYAITGMYFYANDVVSIAKSLTPSNRGELEITDLNKVYLREARMKMRSLGRGMAWLDTGTPDALLDAANYIASIERRQGMKIACLEEIAWRNGWISFAQFKQLAGSYKNSTYGQYIYALCNQVELQHKFSNSSMTSL